MVRTFSKITILSIFILFFTTNLQAKLIVNEVMSNEPGGNTALEWMEIYNDSPNINNLRFASLMINGINYSLSLHDVGIVEAYQYAIICKDIVKYDSVWGDNSGTWGDDSTIENYPAYEVSGFNLTNPFGNIILTYFSDTSGFSWNLTGGDGVSWERIYLDSGNIGQSLDPTGSTPGKVNSIAVLHNDLELLPVSVRPIGNNLTEFEIKIANIGLDTVNANFLKVYYNDDADSLADSTDLIVQIGFNNIAPDDTISIEYIDFLIGVFPKILMRLPDDDRLSNNIELTDAFGFEYPPILVSEFLPDPTDNLQTEWVELKNYSDVDVDINGWFIGDLRDWRPIANDSRIINANSYTVLCKDSTALLDYYNGPDISILQLSSWPIFNNDEDIIRLKDNYDLTADSLFYNYTYGENISWARSEDPDVYYAWGRSADIGGTPCEPNVVYLPPSSPSIEVNVDPNPFSPSINDQMTIEFKVPQGERIVIRVYDLEGRIVRTLLDESDSFDGFVYWNGKDDNNRNLIIGMYILYIEVTGVDAYKQTVVVAP